MEKKVKIRVVIALVVAVIALILLFLPNIIYLFKGQTYFLENINDYNLTPFVYGGEINLSVGEKKETEFFSLKVTSFNEQEKELNFEIKGKSKFSLGRVCYFESLKENKIDKTLTVKAKINNQYYHMERKSAVIKQGKTDFIFVLTAENLEGLQDFSFCDIIINEFKRK